MVDSPEEMPVSLRNLNEISSFIPTAMHKTMIHKFMLHVGDQYYTTYSSSIATLPISPTKQTCL